MLFDIQSLKDRSYFKNDLFTRKCLEFSNNTVTYFVINDIHKKGKFYLIFTEELSDFLQNDAEAWRYINTIYYTIYYININ